MMDVSSLMELSGRVHLLVQLQKQESLEHPELCRWSAVCILEHLPAEMPGEKVGQLGPRLCNLWPIGLVQTGCSNRHHGNQEQVWRLVRLECRLVQDRDLVAEVEPI